MMPPAHQPRVQPYCISPSQPAWCITLHLLRLVTYLTPACDSCPACAALRRLVDQWDLFGIRQAFMGDHYTQPGFKVKLFYKVRRGGAGQGGGEASILSLASR